MKLLSALFSLLVCCLLSGPALALSDADYARYMKESPAFAQADARLNAAWKRLKSGYPKPVYQALQEEQRQWVKLRDATVKVMQYADGKRSPAEAYAAETLKRAEELEARATHLPASPQSAPDKSAASPQPAPKQPAALQPVPEQPAASANLVGDYVNETGGLEITQGDKGLWVRFSASAPGDARWVCGFEGPGKVEGDILTIVFDAASDDTLRIKKSGDRLEIGEALNPKVEMSSFCGAGGTIAGAYVRK